MRSGDEKDTHRTCSLPDNEMLRVLATWDTNEVGNVTARQRREDNLYMGGEGMSGWLRV